MKESIFFKDKGEKMDQNILTFSGNNEQLFTKTKIGSPINQKLVLLVPETHNAILVKDGQMLQTLSSGKYLISKFVDLKTEPDANLEVLFMSKTAKLKLLWGTAQMFLMYDPQLDENYKVGMSGDFDVQIGDPRKCYLYLVGANENLTAEELQSRLTITVVSVLENEVVEYVEQNKIMYNQITVKKRDISAKVLNKVHQKLMSDYGIAVFSFNIANVIIDENDRRRLSNIKKGVIEVEAPVEEPTPVVEDKNVCSNCGKALRPNAKFCDNCGQKIGGNPVCPNCGVENSPEAKFCLNCGNKL